MSIRLRSLLFQFTLPRGERPSPTSLSLTPWMFQFTLPRGERQICQRSLSLGEGFQFTLPRGERLTPELKSGLPGWFQFTLPRGERHPFSISLCLFKSFNSRSREGSDLSIVDGCRPSPRFNSRSREGSDSGKIFRKSLKIKFQFTLPRGERLSRQKYN